MKLALPILSLIVVFSSCSTAYKTGQTPDDVYFSPTLPKEEYTRNNNDRKEEKRQEEEYNAYNDDRYIRMKVRDRSRWSQLDDYYSDPYAYSYQGCYCNCNVNPRLYWSYHYSPYASNVVIVNPHSPVYSKPRVFNLSTYYPANPTPSKSSASQSSRRVYTSPVRVSTETNNTGNTLRNIFRTTESSVPTKSNSTSNNSSSNSSSSSSSSSSSTNNGNAPVRKF